MKMTTSLRFGILAFPAFHSLSPHMHNAAFFATGTNASYERFEISPENIANFFAELKEKKHIAGLSVSVPHKETVQKFLDAVDESVEKIGAVNTIFWEHEKLCGTNTDWKGFLQALTEKTEISGKKILILGAGGAARAAIFALLSQNVEKIFLWNRTQKNALELKNFFQDSRLEILDDVFSVQNEAEIIINTTSLGMKGDQEKFSPIPATFWKPQHVAFDMVYTPRITTFLQDANNANVNIITGEKMLLFQGMEQFKIFTGKNPPQIVMEKALEKTENFVPFIFSEAQKKDVLGTIVAEKKSSLRGGGTTTKQSHPYHENDEIVTFIPLACNNNSSLHHSFKKSLSIPRKIPHLIAEIKPASPSKGKLFQEGDSVEAFAMAYESMNATAISVLTDEKFFGGSLENIAKVRAVSSLPILRKDFILSESQIFEAKEMGANAVLLMRSVLSAEKMEEFLQILKTLEMDALVEVHTQEELVSVMTETSAEIIGVNARNLHTLEIFPERFQEIFTFAYENFANAKEKIWVAESGISSQEKREKYAKNANAILVGSGIVSAPNRVEFLHELLS